MTNPLTCKTKVLAGGAAILMALTFSTPSVEAKELRAKTPAPAMGLKAPGAGPAKDFSCGANQMYSCDNPYFYSDCKKLGGTVSGVQGFGGRTCWEPT